MQYLASGLIRRSWIVFIHAVLISLESIAIEFLTVRSGIPPLVLAATGIPIAGGILVIVEWRKRKSKESERDQLFAVFRASRPLLAGSALLALGLFTWYDSIDRVGAAKESLIAGPLETVFILFLARLVLFERLRLIQLGGAGVAIAGFFITVASGGSGISPLSLGDVEAILSAVFFACGIIVITKLAEHYSSTGVTTSILLLSGLMLLAAVPFAYWLGLGGLDGLTPGKNAHASDYASWPASILLFSLLPLSAALTYVTGLARIGASLTSTIASFSIVVILVIQLAQRAAGYSVILPANIPLALLGGLMAVIGISLIHIAPRRGMSGSSGSEHVTTAPV
ncbi:MAG: EamA family transporter [Nitrososphaera sp.]|jgi:drug/metabolite transporter (DMT)-like permease